MVAARAVREEPTPVAVVPPPTATPEHDLVDEWGEQSFPASDPPSNW